MTEILCPVCGKRHECVPYQCVCGYAETRSDEKFNTDEKNCLFSIYKFSKLIFNKKIDWEQSRYDVREYDDRIVVQDIFEEKAIAYVDCDIEGKETAVEDGILAFNRNVRSLIINANIIDHEILDESAIKMLFLGDKVKELTSLLQGSLKYIEVAENNQFFKAENNVLFNKDMTRLIHYCPDKPDSEYTIPKSVKEVACFAFLSISDRDDGLKIIHCSKKVKFEAPLYLRSPYADIKIVYDQD